MAILASDFAVFDRREIEPPRPVYRKDPPNPEAIGRRVYRVEAGDTLAGIAKRTLGDGRRWRRIFEANRRLLASPDRLQPG
ncbi:MAG: LysM peptidoglycan-binding domain-containing protein, partial [Planctomycetes bacterium]|nr:LysM peptidoglycan-binding domain-containing protein [Planctomycetota bacterium]